MAVTHADLDIDRRSRLAGKRGAFSMLFCSLLGVASFVLCLYAEASRSRILWAYDRRVPTLDDDNVAEIECLYSKNGNTPLTCAVAALLGIVLALTIGQSFLFSTILASSDDRGGLLSIWLSSSISSASVRWHVAFCFLMSWVCFSVATVLLLIGIAVEADHLRNWQLYHLRCFVVRQGLFASAGVFSLASTSFNGALYIAARQTMKSEARESENWPDLYASNGSLPTTRMRPASDSTHMPGNLHRESITTTNSEVFVEVNLKGR